MADNNPTQSEMRKDTRSEPTSDKDAVEAKARPDATGSQAEPADDQLHHDIEPLRAELDAAKDRALRFQAELDNYRKRVNRQMEEERRYAQVPLIRDLLPVLDNINRAIEAAEKTADTGALLAGFKMVGRQLRDALEQHHCTEIDALRQPFDPNWHEAILQQPSSEYPANTVVNVTQAGYRVHDRVVRPAQVIVSAAAPEADAREKASQDRNNGPH